MQKTKLGHYQKQMAKKTILIIGDLVYKLGGAAKIAVHIKKLGAKALLVGTVGNDNYGQQLLSSLAQNKIEVDTIKIDPLKPTPTNPRPSPASHNPVLEKELINLCLKLIPNVSGVLISDYSMGTLTPKLAKEVIKVSCHFNIPIVLDALNPNIASRDLTILLLGQKEAEQISGLKIINDKNLERTFKILKRKTKSQAIVLRHPKGLYSYIAEQEAESFRFQKTKGEDLREVISALVGLALATGANPNEAAQIATLLAK